MKEKILSGIVMDEQTTVTIEEITQACFCKTEWVIELVDEGILEPIGRDREKWQFTSLSLLRARTARRLQQDLGINLAGVALAIDLMQEIEDLQVRVDYLKSGL